MLWGFRPKENSLVTFRKKHHPAAWIETKTKKRLLFKNRLKISKLLFFPYQSLKSFKKTSQSKISYKESSSMKILWAQSSLFHSFFAMLVLTHECCCTSAWWASRCSPFLHLQSILEFQAHLLLLILLLLQRWDAHCPGSLCPRVLCSRKK